MPTIYVNKAFKLRHKDDEGKSIATEFPVGNHKVTAAVAAHWFVKAHTGDEPPIDPEAQAAADELLAELEGKAQELDRREKYVTGMEKAMTDHMADITGREEALVMREKAADQRETDLNARAEALDAREVTIAEREKAVEAAAKQPGKK